MAKGIGTLSRGKNPTYTELIPSHKVRNIWVCVLTYEEYFFLFIALLKKKIKNKTNPLTTGLHSLCLIKVGWSGLEDKR